MAGSDPPYDVIMVSDLRFPGGSSASLAEEIKAQAVAGLRTGVVHVDSPVITSPTPVNPRVEALLGDGMADLIPPDGSADADLIVLRHPGVFARPPERFPTVTANHVVLVANQVPDDGTSSYVYDPAVVHRNVSHALRHEPLWAPIGDRVRDSLVAADRLLPVVGWNWVNVIDPDEWGAPRSGLLGSRPVIGRHSRPSVLKWPEDPGLLRAAYPTDGSVGVRILGGGDALRSILGETPRAWDVIPFGGADPAEFLRAIDFFVYQHHSALVEAFGRAVLEALASGAVAIVPPELAAVFGNACLYARPHEVRTLIKEYAADDQRFAAQSRRGYEFVRRAFSYRVHEARHAYVRSHPAPVRARSGIRPPTRLRPLRPLFVCTNGTGVGHLNRVSAIARRASGWTRPVILSMCAATEIPQFAGVEVEWFPSRKGTGLDKEDWNRRILSRLEELMELHESDVLVFDGPWPFKGVIQSRDRAPDVPLVWCRRGGSKGSAQVAASRSRYFDRVVVPGEVTCDTSDGEREDPDVVRVGPILLLDESDLLTTADARRELGIDPDRDAVLVQLGAGNINDIRPVVRNVVETLGGRPDLQICVARSAIANDLSTFEGVVEISVYPLSRLFRAFLFGVVACGYNTLHEAVAFQLPTLLIPNASTRTDDQERRARAAERLGIALCADPDDPDGVRSAIESLFQRDVRASIVKRCQEVFPGNGAAAAMSLIEDLAIRRRA